MVKQYKYRGWINLLVAVISVTVAIIGTILVKNAGFLALLSCNAIPQLCIFAGQRKLTEQQWRTQNNDKDERYRLGLWKAGAITAMILEGLTGAALIWAAFRDTDDFAIVSLGVIFMVGGVAFCILQSIFYKKM